MFLGSEEKAISFFANLTGPASSEGKHHRHINVFEGPKLDSADVEYFECDKINSHNAIHRCFVFSLVESFTSDRRGYIKIL